MRAETTVLIPNHHSESWFGFSPKMGRQLSKITSLSVRDKVKDRNHLESNLDYNEYWPFLFRILMGNHSEKYFNLFFYSTWKSTSTRIQ